MRGIILFTIAFSALSSWAAEPPHYDLEMSSQEYRKLLPKIQSQGFDEKLGPVDTALKAGDKLFTWIEKINAQRPEDQKIRLTSKSTRKGIPITKPSRYGPVKIKNDLNQLRADIPNSLKEVIFQNKKPTADPTVEDKVFIEYGRRVDRLYQTASRWKLLQPYKGYYAQRRIQDVRGYYFLNTNGWNEERIAKEYAQLEGEKLRKVNNALIGICVNSGLSSAGCRTDINDANKTSDIVRFYKRYISRAQQTWNRFFQIQNKRRDIKWRGLDAKQATIPFLDPVDVGVQNYIKGNIEDEFQWNDWGLKINFVEKRPAPYVVFVPGATPNVNGLGGNKITMDGNKSIEEYEVQWIIRHEFGHVLGIPDCYHEFYDRDNNEFVNYQLDTTDLMCSRAGNMNERLYEDLKEAYAKY